MGSAIAVWWGLDGRAARKGGANVTRQAETGMIQPCSDDGGMQGETEMQEEEREEYWEHMVMRRKIEKGERERAGRYDHDRDDECGVYAYSMEEPTLGWAEACINRERLGVNEAR